MIGSHWGHLGARGPALGARETPFKTPGPATARVDGSGGGGTRREDQVRAGGAGRAEPGGAPGRGSRGTASPPWSCSPMPARRIESLLGARDLETDRQTAQEQRKRRGRPDGQSQGETEGTTSRAKNGVRESKQLRARKSAELEIPRQKERRVSRGQKRAEAETEASARGDAGTRRERFGSVTVLPHLEDITSPPKKNKYKKGLDIKRRQILLSLEGVGRRWPG